MEKELETLNDFLKCVEVGSSITSQEHEQLAKIAVRLKTDVPGAIQDFKDAKFEAGKPSLRVAQKLVESVLIAHHVGSVRLSG